MIAVIGYDSNKTIESSQRLSVTAQSLCWERPISAYKRTLICNTQTLNGHLCRAANMCEAGVKRLKASNGSCHSWSRVHAKVGGGITNAGSRGKMCQFFYACLISTFSDKLIKIEHINSVMCCMVVCPVKVRSLWRAARF